MRGALPCTAHARRPPLNRPRQAPSMHRHCEASSPAHVIARRLHQHTSLRGALTSTRHCEAPLPAHVIARRPKAEPKGAVAIAPRIRTRIRPGTKTPAKAGGYTDIGPSGKPG